MEEELHKQKNRTKFIFIHKVFIYLYKQKTLIEDRILKT